MGPVATDKVNGMNLNLDVCVVGAGLGGVYALYKMRQIGLSAKSFETGSGAGGTWFWNSGFREDPRGDTKDTLPAANNLAADYFGARCDIESLEYSYSFSEELQNEWHWPERYATQPVIRDYVNFVVDKFDLRRDIQFNTRVVSATFDNQSGLWTVKTDKGDVVTARYCIMATGNLSTPRVPDFKGVKSFQGKWYHTGMWPSEPVSFNGLRVGIIGTGSSAIQAIPIIAKQAKHLFVFQRTPNFSLPAQNRPMDPDEEKDHRSRWAARVQDARQTAFGVSGVPIPTKSALAVSAEEREANYEAMWQKGGTIPLLNCYNDFLVNEEANETAAEFVRKKIRGIVKDPKVAKLLCPTDHPIGAKRLCLDTGYYETYNRDNVTLVDVRSAPIEEITPTGLKTTMDSYELDAIVFATGYDAITGALREIEIRGSDGELLTKKWEAGPKTYLGIMYAGLPNFFIITGPGSPGVKSQMIHSIEQHVDWVADLLVHMRSNGQTRVEPTEEAQEAWLEHVNKVANSTLYVKAKSWYNGSNIPGKLKIFLPYVAGVSKYRQKCDEVAANGYEGFVLSQ